MSTCTVRFVVSVFLRGYGVCAIIVRNAEPNKSTVIPTVIVNMAQWFLRMLLLASCFYERVYEQNNLTKLIPTPLHVGNWVMKRQQTFLTHMLSSLTVRPLVWPWQQVCVKAVRTRGCEQHEYSLWRRRFTLWNSMTSTPFVFTELANTMKYGEGLLYNLVYSEWRHCVSQNEVWERGVL